MTSWSYGFGHNSNALKSAAMYAVTFDLDASILKELYPSQSWNDAYTDVQKALEPFGFSRQQGSVYFGDDSVDAVKCVLAVMDIAQRFSWFKSAV
ncbi:hypothetical protein CCP2SC5_100016 [Azospirillaceae bacterium]